MSEMEAMSPAGKVLFRSHIVAIATAFLLNFALGVSADVGAALQNSVDGRITRDGIDLFYKVVGPAAGDYVLVLSGGTGEDIHSMQGIADELGKKYRCVMWEQRGTGRSKLPTYDSSTINLNAYIEDIEALRKQLHAQKFIVVGNSWGMILGLAYAGTHPDAVHAVVTIGSGPITFEYLGVFSDNQFATRSRRTRSARLLERSRARIGRLRPRRVRASARGNGGLFLQSKESVADGCGT